MLDKAIIIVGYSGHAFVVADAALSNKMNLVYYSEKKDTTFNPYNLQYLGNENDSNFKGWNLDADFILGIGQNALRAKIGLLLKQKNKNVLNVIHPSANVSDNVKIGIGNFVSKSALINPLVTIENFCILNTGCVIEHECFIKNGAHIAPGAILAGNVAVGDNTFIGANATIKQGIKIGKNVIIGAGSVVLNNISDNETWVGNPAKKIN